MLTDKQGCALLIGTPLGLNHFYDAYMRGQDDEFKDWASWQFTTLQGGNVSKKELNTATKVLSTKVFKQEFEASFETSSGKVYYEFSRSLHIRSDILSTSHSELWVGLDFNVNPMCAVIGAKAADEIHIFDYLEISNSNTYEVADELRRRYPRNNITIYPDPTGKARKSSSQAGITDFSILRNAGFKVLAPNKAPFVRDRINTVNSLLKNTEGRARCFIHPRCKPLIKALEGLTYKKETNQVDKNTGFDHITDALGYLICYEFPIQATRFSLGRTTGY